MKISPLIQEAEDNLNYHRPWLKFYNKDTPSSLIYPDRTIYEMLLDSAQTYPEHVALEFMGKRIKFQKLIQEVDNCARALSELGATAEDAVTVCMPNTPHAVIMFYAINKLGALANMIHPLSAPKEMEFYLKHVESKFILIGDFSYPHLKKVQSNLELKKVVVARISDYLGRRKSMGFWALEGHKIPKVKYNENNLLISWKKFKKLGYQSNRTVESKMKCADGAVVLYTGGTTGIQKGVLLSNYNFNALVIQCLGHLNDEKFGEISRDKIMCILPIFHGFGLTVCVHLPMCVGASAILVPKFDANIFADQFAKHQPHFIAGVPTLYEALLRSKKMKKSDFSGLKGIFAGGDSVPVELKREFDQFMKKRGGQVTMQEGYGLTETVTVSCLVPNTDDRTGSIGVPLPDMLYKIVKVGTTQDLPPGEEGEICISGPTVMLEYYNNQEETDKVLKVHTDGFKWCHTGDLGYMDDDGFFYFRSRIKRMIKSSGYSVFPTQIEGVINRHEAVALSCVIGVPDKYQIEKIKAFLVLKEGFTDSDRIKKEIIDLCREYLATWSVPREIEIRKELPTTLIGKVDWLKLKEEYAEV
ncbi:MAG: AMP-binding protein [Methanobacteriaceae archaeon]